MKQLSYLGMLMIGLMVCQCNSTSSKITENEILWDTWGVPHIYATNENNLYYAFGWAQAYSHGDLILKLYGEARGKAAEYWGEEHYQTDLLVQQFALPQTASTCIGQLSAEELSLLQSFADGINAYAASHPEGISDQRKVVLPIVPQDIIAHAYRDIYLEFLLKGSYYQAQGWTHTVNTIDNVDLFELDLEDDKYRLDGQYVNLETQYIPMRIKTDSGSYKHDTLIVKKSRHGIIVKEDGKNAIALRFSGMDNPLNILKSWYNMGKASSLEAFEDALRQNEIPMFNVLYADKQKNILYHFGGHVPKKSEATWNDWRGITSGDESTDIWSSLHPYEDCPTLKNPQSGWLQNANEPPYTSTIPPELRPNDFPGYMAPNFMGFRPQQSALLLMQDDHISFDEMVEYKHSTQVLLAERLMDDLLPLRHSTSDSLTLTAFSVLESWDRCFNADSKGAVLFIQWIQEFARNGFDNIFETPWSFENPTETPDGIRDHEKAVQALYEASHSLLELAGRLDVPYGDLFRLKVGAYEFPANGGYGYFGLFRTLAFQKGENQKQYAFHGETFVAAVEFGNKIKAKVLLSYGNATQPGNKHVGDQLSLLAEQQLRDAWLQKEEVEKNLEFRESLALD